MPFYVRGFHRITAGVDIAFDTLGLVRSSISPSTYISLNTSAIIWLPFIFVASPRHS